MNSRMQLAWLPMAVSSWMGPCHAESTGDKAPHDWLEYVNPAAGYGLWHPPTWRPRLLSDGSLYSFTLPAGAELEFSVTHLRQPADQTLEGAFQAWRADLERAEGGRYLLAQARETRLGAARAFEIPMAPSATGYETRLWLLDLEGQKYSVLARVDNGQETVRRVLSTMRRTPEEAQPSSP